MPRGSTKQEVGSHGAGAWGSCFFFYKVCVKDVVAGFGTAGFVMVVVLFYFWLWMVFGC